MVIFRNRTDMNIVLDTIIEKTIYHDEVSKNFHYAMKDIRDTIDSVVEAVNISYHLQK